MSRLSRALLYDPDERAASTLAFGLEREGVKVAKPTDGQAAVQLAADAGDGDTGLDIALVGGDVQVVRDLRARVRVPILYLGREEQRAAALAAGANDVLSKPVFVRDVLTLARLHALRNGASSKSWTGELGDFYNLFYLIRALATARRTGILTLLRGGRRGELRFYEGEVTSAHTGLLHGLAALHQLLLWTEGRFELRNEAIVRRQQIPLQPAELFEDAQRFLRDFRELGADLSPSAVYEQDLRRVAECVDQIPKEVSPVLRLFDGVRTIADVVEDSPFRPFETVKIAVRLVELEAVTRISTPRARSGASAALAIEDWLVGNATPSGGIPAVLRAVESQPAMSSSAAGLPAAPLPAGERKDKDKKKKKKRKGSDGEASKDTAQRILDWGPIVPPSVAMWEGQGYAPVVPSQATAGEIEMGEPAGASNEAENRMLAASAQAVADVPRPHPVVEGLLSGESRERLEDVLDREQRASLFADGPPEPTPVDLPPVLAVVAADSVATPEAAPSPPAPEPPAPEAAVPEPPAPETAASTVAAALAAARAAEPAPVSEADAGASEPVAAASEPTPEPTPAVVVSLAPVGTEPAVLITPIPIPIPIPTPIPIPEARSPEARSPEPPIPEARSPEPPPPEARSPEPPPPAQAKPVAPTRPATDPGPPATFDDIDEEFFSQEAKYSPDAPVVPTETFDDLDEGEPPPRTFWQRLFKKESGPPIPRPSPRGSARPAQRPAQKPGPKKKR